MRTLINIFLVGIFSIAAFQGGKYGLKKTANYIQMPALEKAPQGLRSFEGAIQKMTGGKLGFQEKISSKRSSEISFLAHFIISSNDNV